MKTCSTRSSRRCARSSSEPSTSSRSHSRQQLLAHALWLSWASICFGLAAGSLSVASGIADHSLGVLAAGLSVLADVMSSIVLVWRFWSERTARGHGERLEALATRAVVGCLALIALALAYESLSALLSGSHPGSSVLTIVVAAVSFVVLAPLAALKRVTAARLASHALRGDSTISAIGSGTAVLALIGLALFHLVGWWWADRVVALVIAAVAALEARTLLVAERASD